MTTDIDERPTSKRARKAADDLAVIERAQDLMTLRGGIYLTRADVHQAERELGLRLTIAPK